ncbi:MAG: aminotransferase class I/II-fold pyridoxal phosphate-dependent enzyme [Opitutales bacterium]|nr:aminotransferase class I/II-fold pyridoxal phosphate-dependent enzyme [Opitutales bacterium]
MENSFYKISKTVSSLSAYTPGEQPKGGGWTKLNTNEFPYPPSPKVREAILQELGDDCAALRLYPAPLSDRLRAEVANFYGVEPKNAIGGNGSDDVLNLVMRAFGDENLKVAAMNPSYSLYPVLSKMQGAELLELDFECGLKLPLEKIVSSGANVFILTNPNAPLGVAFSDSEVEYLADNFKGLFVIDEAYAPFSGKTFSKFAASRKNVLCVGTSSKGWGLAGMRVGWAVGDEDIIKTLDVVRDSYNIDRLACAAAVAALRDSNYYENARRRVVESREDIEKFFGEMGWNYVKSSSNFVFVRPNKKGLSPAQAAKSYFEFLKADKILVRFWPNDKKICDGLRITVGTPSDMQKLKESSIKWKNQE